MGSMNKEPIPGANARLLWLGDHFGYAGATIHGATTYYLSVLPRLKEAGVRLTACFLGAPHPAGADLAKQGVEPIMLGRRKWDARAFQDILGILRERDINLVHAVGMKSILLSRAAARFWYGVPVVSHFHDTNRAGWLPERWLRASAGWSASSLAISEAVARFAVATLGVDEAQIQVLYNGIDVDRVAGAGPADRQRLRQSFGLSDAIPVIGIIGRFSWEKGHLQFLEALPRLLAERPDAKVWLVGDGDQRIACQRLVRQLGLQDAVRFTGFRFDIAAILQAVDVVAIPSIEEGLSFAALEAMAAGTPVVASAVGGLPEIVHHGETGLLAGPQDMAGMMQALAALFSDQALRASLVAGGRKIAAKLSLDAHVRALLGEYDRLLAGVPRPRGVEVQRESLWARNLSGEEAPPASVTGEPEPRQQ
jgi:glycosyltransferase involved in cell wall biosynthesis